MKTRKHSFSIPTFIAVLFLVTAVLAVQPAWSEYPEEPVTIFVGMAPGGGTDLMVRAMVPTASAALGKPIVVENKAGGAGGVALGLVANAKPDGYTLAAVQNASVVEGSLLNKVSFKPLASFTPVLVFSCTDHSALLVKSDAPWKTFQEFVDYAKKNPGKVKYSSAGVGSGMHVAMEEIAKKEGIKWVHIPHKGTNPARIALLGGHVDACASGADWPSFVESGQLRALATHGEKRCPATPNVPTQKELGYGFVSDVFHCLVGPAGIPQEAVKKLETAFKKATETPEYQQVLKQLNYTPRFVYSKEFTQHLNERWVKTEKLFKELGIIQEAATQPR